MKTLLTATTLLILLTFFSCSKKTDNPTPTTPAHSLSDDVVGTYSGSVLFSADLIPFFFDNTTYTRRDNENIVVTKVNETTVHISKKVATDYMEEFDVNIETSSSGYYNLTIPHQTFSSGNAQYIDEGGETYPATPTVITKHGLYSFSDKYIWILEQGTTFGGTYFIKKFIGTKQ